MKIGYKKKYVNLNLFLGIVWLTNAIIQTTINESPSWFDFIWYVLSFFYFLIFFYQRKEKYLTIESGVIRQNWPFGKKLNLTEIEQIRHFAGEYILKTELNEMKINIGLIDNESLSDLKSELNKLNADWT